ncbi:glutaredoxin family protein [Litchfieldella xinjiangensis]|uniref:glutaredoxin family protein n=1 Tax=Litchfieldella xinjiangensis TaxID=1166948 RepID=UPI0009DDD5E6|nr:glutathione S-transferase N-terminal domain-containing protein [Halomonas xinjiangensis]
MSERDRKPQDLALYHYEGCPFCTRVRNAISRLNIDLKLHDIMRDPGARQRLIAGGGRKTVPCLRIDEGEKTTWMYESRDIINYLERKFS